MGAVVNQPGMRKTGMTTNLGFNIKIMSGYSGSTGKAERSCPI